MHVRLWAQILIEIICNILYTHRNILQLIHIPLYITAVADYIHANRIGPTAKYCRPYVQGKETNYSDHPNSNFWFIFSTHILIHMNYSKLTVLNAIEFFALQNCGAPWIGGPYCFGVCASTLLRHCISLSLFLHHFSLFGRWFYCGLSNVVVDNIFNIFRGFHWPLCWHYVECVRARFCVYAILLFCGVVCIMHEYSIIILFFLIYMPFQ